MVRDNEAPISSVRGARFLSLYSATLRSSLLAIKADWRPITSVSVVLVLLTACQYGDGWLRITARLTIFPSRTLK